MKENRVVWKFNVSYVPLAKLYHHEMIKQKSHRLMWNICHGSEQINKTISISIISKNMLY